MIVQEEFYINEPLRNQIINDGYLTLQNDFVPGSVSLYLNGILQDKSTSSSETGFYREDPDNRRIIFLDPTFFMVGDYLVIEYDTTARTPSIPIGAKVWGDLHLLLSDTILDKVANPGDDGARWSFQVRQTALLSAFNEIVVPLVKGGFKQEVAELYEQVISSGAGISNISFDGNYLLCQAQCGYRGKLIDLPIVYKEPSDFDFARDFYPRLYFFKRNDKFKVSMKNEFLNDVSTIWLNFIRVDNFPLDYPLWGSFWSKFAFLIVSKAQEYLTKLEVNTL
jgi:hypothetical protein